jgi:hypothetical protein
MNNFLPIDVTKPYLIVDIWTIIVNIYNQLKLKEWQERFVLYTFPYDTNLILFQYQNNIRYITNTDTKIVNIAYALDDVDEYIYDDIQEIWWKCPQCYDVTKCYHNCWCAYWCRKCKTKINNILHGYQCNNTDECYYEGNMYNKDSDIDDDYI